MKIFTIKNHIRFSSEQIILFGLLKEIPNEPLHCYNFKNESRYKNLIDYCRINFTYVDNPNEADILVLPFRYILSSHHKFKNIHDSIFKYLNNLSISLKKPLLCFFNDDYNEIINITSNIILYRTGFYKSTQQKNERALPAFSPDYYRNYFINNKELSIGYCGHRKHGRNKYLSLLDKSKIKTNFILRDVTFKMNQDFWAPEISKKQARIDFFKNIEDNNFIFCYRGAGNFSYRFYEILMMGRIPILINTDCVFPFWDEVSQYNIGLIIDEEDIKENNTQIKEKLLIDLIEDYYLKNKDNLIEIQKNNRLIWENYYSPIGFLKNMRREHI